MKEFTVIDSENGITDVEYYCINSDNSKHFASLTWCEDNCLKYYSCDKIALANDFLVEYERSFLVDDLVKILYNDSTFTNEYYEENNGYYYFISKEKTVLIEYNINDNMSYAEDEKDDSVIVEINNINVIESFELNDDYDYMMTTEEAENINKLLGGILL